MPGCREEPDSTKCRELYELLTLFTVKGPIEYSVLCQGLPGLSTPQHPGHDGGDLDSGCTAAHPSLSSDIDTPLPGPASEDEKTAAAVAGEALEAAVTADGNTNMIPAIPLLVWLMRLIVQPRVTFSDGHLWGLLSLTRVLVQALGACGKREVGLRGLELIGVPPICWGGRQGREIPEEIVHGRAKGLLYYVYHDCLFDIATDQNHGPLAPPKCRYVPNNLPWSTLEKESHR